MQGDAVSEQPSLTQDAEAGDIEARGPEGKTGRLEGESLVRRISREPK